MRPPIPVLWALLASAAVWAAAWAASGRPVAAAAVGLLSLGASLWVAFVTAARWRTRADALAAAARGVSVELTASAAADPHGPAALAREVQTTAATAREASRELATLRAVIDGMAEGVWITDADGTVRQHNNALKELLFTGQAIVGQRPLELVRSAELQAAVERACGEGASAQLELAVESVRPRALTVQVTPLGHDLPGSSAVFIDVTELRRLEKVRKDFVANVSHELRTPVTAIRGYSETLKDGALKDAVNAPKMVEIIHRQAERLSELVDDLLELSRLESRELNLAKVAVDLAQAAERASEDVRPKAEARGTAVELNVPAGLKALADQRGVEQVLLNLLDNAVKYGKPAGRVVVTARPLDGRVELAVKDDGPGIEARHLERVFERFYRVDKGRSREMGGTGLGLSIVKHLVTSMHGEVRVESQPGQGSTFLVELPAANGETPPTSG